MDGIVFRVVDLKEPVRVKSGEFILIKDDWDDFSFKTSFALSYIDGDRTIDIGLVKIARRGMREGDSHTNPPRQFYRLSEDFFSLGQDREYYEALLKLPENTRVGALTALNDISFDDTLHESVRGEEVYEVSLLRNLPEKTVFNQFRRISKGQEPLIDYRFSYVRGDFFSVDNSLEMTFDINPESMPPFEHKRFDRSEWGW